MYTWVWQWNCHAWVKNAINTLAASIQLFIVSLCNMLLLLCFLFIVTASYLLRPRYGYGSIWPITTISVAAAILWAYSSGNNNKVMPFFMWAQGMSALRWTFLFQNNACPYFANFFFLSYIESRNKFIGKCICVLWSSRKLL